MDSLPGHPQNRAVFPAVIYAAFKVQTGPASSFLVSGETWEIQLVPLRDDLVYATHYSLPPSAKVTGLRHLLEVPLTTWNAFSLLWNIR